MQLGVEDVLLVLAIFVGPLLISYDSDKSALNMLSGIVGKRIGNYDLRGEIEKFYYKNISIIPTLIISFSGTCVFLLWIYDFDIFYVYAGLVFIIFSVIIYIINRYLVWEKTKINFIGPRKREDV
ncbi:MAG: hypothetical protein ACK41P_05295 [Asticcacaulis sp.]